MVFFPEINVFLQLSLKVLCGTKKAHLHLEKAQLHEVSFQKLTQFSQGNSVLDGPTSDFSGFLWRDLCVSSAQLNRPIWKQESLSSPSKN